MNYRTLADMAALIRKNLHLIPRLPVVGIPRSGMIAASMIATLKNIPLYTFGAAFAQDAGWILVDDTISGGETMNQTMRRCAALGMIQPTTLTVWRKPNSPPVDICFETLPGPRLFEWNWTKHAHTKRAVFDIDGVLCTELVRNQIIDWTNVDPEYYKNLRSQESLLHKPARKVLAIATGRKETARAFTEEWLARHGITYQHIYFSTPERGARQTKLHAIRETGAHWMVESNAEQAAWLRDRAQVPILCTDLNRMF